MSRARTDEDDRGDIRLRDGCGFCTWWPADVDERTALRIVGFSDCTDVAEPVRDAVEFLRQFEDDERIRERSSQWVADNRGRLGTSLSKTPPARQQSDDG
ncbi:hypothetical protein [Natrinema pallidum]|uniref:Uncharacterized protein n=1 Tax=Natrinema pallidum DSM 3751 TaxID=1227495 RepID=L9YTH5_9EURY|nr:hypothetical protein C487_12116 [Natrinema pallidum DSM 3751]